MIHPPELKQLVYCFIFMIAFFFLFVFVLVLKRNRQTLLTPKILKKK